MDEFSQGRVYLIPGFAAQAKTVRFESAGGSVLHAPTFGLNPGDATRTQMIGWPDRQRCADYTTITGPPWLDVSPINALTVVSALPASNCGADSSLLSHLMASAFP